MEPHYNDPNNLRKCVESINSFRKTDESQSAVCIPEIPQRRKLTDIAFLITFGICFVVLIGILAYALTLSDIDRFMHGYDNCGNVCGKKNKPIDGIPCRQDMTDKPQVFYNMYYVFDDNGNYKEITIGTCAASWSDFNSTGSRQATRFNVVSHLVDSINNNWGRLIGLCFIGLAISLAMLVFFRFFVSIFVWTMMVLYELILIAFAIFGWYMFSQYGVDVISFPIIMTIIAVIFLIVILVLLPRMKLVIMCLKEAVNIIFFIPLLLLQPLLTYAAQFLAVGIFVYATILMTTAGDLVQIKQRLSYQNDYITYYDYVQNGAIIFALVFNTFMYIWVVTFVLACQQIVISGAVAACYFTRDKLTLISPIYNSFYNLVRFHLGSAAFGSFIVTVANIIKALARSNSNNSSNIFACMIYYCCIKPLAELLKYLTSMAYIQIALHGQSLCKSGMRAVNLLLANVLSALAVNNVGSFVFFMAKMAVVGITVGIGVAMNPKNDDYFWIVIVISAVITFFCVHCIFVVFETALDAIFMCYCEDQCLNDGVVNPYFATLDVHGCIQESQKYQQKLEEKKRSKKCC